MSLIGTRASHEDNFELKLFQDNTATPQTSGVEQDVKVVKVKNTAQYIFIHSVDREIIIYYIYCRIHKRNVTAVGMDLDGGAMLEQNQEDADLLDMLG